MKIIPKLHSKHFTTCSSTNIFSTVITLSLYPPPHGSKNKSTIDSVGSDLGKKTSTIVYTLRTHVILCVFCFRYFYLLVFHSGPRRTGGSRVPGVHVVYGKRALVQVHRQRDTTETGGRRFRRSDIQILSHKQRELRELTFVI